MTAYIEPPDWPEGMTDREYARCCCKGHGRAWHWWHVLLSWRHIG